MQSLQTYHIRNQPPLDISVGPTPINISPYYIYCRCSLFSFGWSVGLVMVSIQLRYTTLGLETFFFFAKTETLPSH